MRGVASPVSAARFADAPHPSSPSLGASASMSDAKGPGAEDAVIEREATLTVVRHSGLAWPPQHCNACPAQDDTHAHCTARHAPSPARTHIHARHGTALQGIALHGTAWHCMALQCTAENSTVRHGAAPRHDHMHSRIRTHTAHTLAHTHVWHSRLKVRTQSSSGAAVPLSKGRVLDIALVPEDGTALPTRRTVKPVGSIIGEYAAKVCACVARCGAPKCGRVSCAAPRLACAPVCKRACGSILRQYPLFTAAAAVPVRIY